MRGALADADHALSGLESVLMLARKSLLARSRLRLLARARLLRPVRSRSWQGLPEPTPPSERWTVDHRRLDEFAVVAIDVRWTARPAADIGGAALTLRSSWRRPEGAHGCTQRRCRSSSREQLPGGHWRFEQDSCGGTRRQATVLEEDHHGRALRPDARQEFVESDGRRIRAPGRAVSVVRARSASVQPCTGHRDSAQEVQYSTQEQKGADSNGHNALIRLHCRPGAIVARRQREPASSELSTCWTTLQSHFGDHAARALTSRSASSASKMPETGHRRFGGASDEFGQALQLKHGMFTQEHHVCGSREWRARATRSNAGFLGARRSEAVRD